MVRHRRLLLASAVAGLATSMAPAGVQPRLAARREWIDRGDRGFRIHQPQAAQSPSGGAGRTSPQRRRCGFCIVATAHQGSVEPSKARPANRGPSSPPLEQRVPIEPTPTLSRWPYSPAQTLREKETEGVGFEPTDPCGSPVFKTAQNRCNHWGFSGHCLAFCPCLVGLCRAARPASTLLESRLSRTDPGAS